MNIIDPEINGYCESITSQESDILKRLNRETNAEVLNPTMLSGHLQGRIFSMIGKMIKPLKVLEIGTYTGYSAICFAEGLQEGGKIVTIDINEELEDRVRKYFTEAGVSDKVDYRIGDAQDIIPTLEGVFDLVYIDADKKNYSRYYDLAFDKVSVGGFIISDNVLWSGKVVQNDPDEDTKIILAFNQKISEDERVENVLLPVRDGISIVRKVKA